ncbi:hypothetical protein Sango_1906000 [Sesamum angolense]|uniref:Uncharacterized protein n=1 Tax=Sesamum angolense TaxID=2727404 RepID=A0AAE2BQQ8_9LAMI|nr:hypothetical protein Sango_1906000 [Sesamum angolense]
MSHPYAQLIISILIALNVHQTMVFILPKGIIREVEKPLKLFFWKGSSGGYPKVAWDLVYRPLEEGDQGIRDFLVLNRALMVRHLWVVIKEDRYSIWVD